MRVVQYGVHDVHYPRNVRMRAFLSTDLGAEVTVVERTRSGRKLSRAVADVLSLWRASRGADVVVLSEFRLTHAPLAWAVARLRGAQLVVDHFVGLHETVVEDWATVRPGSLAARRLAAQDRLAARLADVCVTDTRPRAERLQELYGRPVLALPVGAPEWARPSTGSATRGDALRFLYYGNYLPLHGVPTIVEILAEVSRSRAVVAEFIGDGRDRSHVQEMVREVGLGGAVRFIDSVPETALAEHIAAADVVFGVFGDSRKARDVVPNKVWQGLACGKTTVTGDGPAVRELVEVVGRQLLVVDRTDAPAAADAILGARADVETAATAHTRLEQFTAAGYACLAAALRPALTS